MPSFARQRAKAGLNFIRLATPTTDAKRLPAVLANTFGVRLLRLDRRHHRHGGARSRRGRSPCGPHQGADRSADRGRLRREDRSAGERARPASPRAWWWARRWSARSPRASMRGQGARREPPRTPVLGLVERLAAALRASGRSCRALGVNSILSGLHLRVS